MPIFSDAFRTQLEHPSATPRWTDVLLSNGGEARMELALRMMAPPVSHGILTLMGSEETNEVNQGIGLFWAVCLAGADGWQAEGLVDRSHVRVSKGDQEILVCPMTSQRFRTPDVQNQRYQKLGAQLERLMPKYKFVAHFKSSIPDNFDGAVLVEPVTNWIQEIERGVWSGGYAIYEDQDVAFELCLLEEPQSENQNGLLFHVAPLCTERVLRHTIPKIVNSATTQTKSDTPLVLLMLADEPWAWNASMLLSVLYGRCTSKTVHSNMDIDHEFLLSDLSLFASDVAKDIASIWWIEPRFGQIPIAGVSHRNPWFSGEAPRFIGPEYTGTANTRANRMVQVALRNSEQPIRWMVGVGERGDTRRRV